jgi:hypothetical protein
VRALGLVLLFLLLAAIAFYFFTLLGAGLGFLLQEAEVGLSDDAVNVVGWICGAIGAVAVLVIGARAHRRP